MNAILTITSENQPDFVQKQCSRQDLVDAIHSVAGREDAIVTLTFEEPINGLCSCQVLYVSPDLARCLGYFLFEQNTPQWRAGSTHMPVSRFLAYLDGVFAGNLPDMTDWEIYLDEQRCPSVNLG